MQTTPYDAAFCCLALKVLSKATGRFFLDDLLHMRIFIFLSTSEGNEGLLLSDSHVRCTMYQTNKKSNKIMEEEGD